MVRVGRREEGPFVVIAPAEDELLVGVHPTSWNHRGRSSQAKPNMPESARRRSRRHQCLLKCTLLHAELLLQVAARKHVWAQTLSVEFGAGLGQSITPELWLYLIQNERKSPGFRFSLSV